MAIQYKATRLDALPVAVFKVSIVIVFGWHINDSAATRNANVIHWTNNYLQAVVVQSINRLNAMCNLQN